MNGKSKHIIKSIGWSICFSICGNSAYIIGSTVETERGLKEFLSIFAKNETGKTIDIIRQMGKCQVILSGAVLVENTRAIRFFEKNYFKLFSTTFLSHDGYEYKDGFMEINLLE